MYKQAPLANILVLFRLISLLACLKQNIYATGHDTYTIEHREMSHSTQSRKRTGSGGRDVM